MLRKRMLSAGLYLRSYFIPLPHIPCSIRTAERVHSTRNISHSSPNVVYKYPVCNVQSTSLADLQSHVLGRRHQTSMASRPQTLVQADKYDIKIDLDSVNFGMIKGTCNTVTASKSVKVVNNGPITVVLVGARLASSKTNTV